MESIKAKCVCDIKTEIKSDSSKVEFYPNKLIENFYNVESYTNLKVVICYEEAFNLNKLKKNYGNYFMIIIGLLFIFSMIFLFWNIDNKIAKIIQKLFFKYKNMIAQLSLFEKEKEEHKNNNLTQIDKKANINLKDKTRKNIKTIDVKLKFKNKKVNESFRSNSKLKTKKSLVKKKKFPKLRKTLNCINQSNSFREMNQQNNNDGIYIYSNQFISSNYNYLIQNNNNKTNLDKEKENKNNEFINKIIYLIPESKRYKYFTEEELNSLDYEYTLKIDFRSYFQFYFSLLKEAFKFIYFLCPK